MRDMIQNHLMQLMSFIAMESPSIFEPEPIRDEIVKVFRSIRPYTVLDMDKMVVRGQYIGYREEKNVASDSNTETYVAMKFFIAGAVCPSISIRERSCRRSHRR